MQLLKEINPSLLSPESSPAESMFRLQLIKPGKEKQTDNSIDAVDGPGLLQAGNLSKSSHVCLLVTHFSNGDKRGSVRAWPIWRSLSLAGLGTQASRP